MGIRSAISNCANVRESIASVFILAEEITFAFKGWANIISSTRSSDSSYVRDQPRHDAMTILVPVLSPMNSSLIWDSLFALIFPGLRVNHRRVVILLVAVQSNLLHLHIPMAYLGYLNLKLYTINPGGALLFHDTYIHPVNNFD